MPVMPLLVERLLGDTDHLSNEEFGAYMRLLLAGWSRDAMLAKEDMPRLARATSGRWPRLWIRLRPFFTEVAPDCYSQKRLSQELDRARTNADANRTRAEKARAGLSRKNNGALRNDRGATRPVTKAVTAPVTEPATAPVTTRKGPAKATVTVPVEPLHPDPEENRALPQVAESPILSSPTPDAGSLRPQPMNGLAAHNFDDAEPASDPSLVERLVSDGLNKRGKQPADRNSLFGALQAAIREDNDD